MCWGIFASQSWTCSISAPSGTDTNLRTNCALSKSDCICTNGVADCDLRAVVIIATGAFAQDTLTGVKGLNDQIDDITENVQDDLEQGNDADRYTFGAPNAGWTGSLAASASATSGNTQNRDVLLAGRLSYGTGVWAHSFGFAGEFGQTDDTKTKQKIYGTYEANRYFNDTTFAFATARASVDEFGALAKDTFIGFGPGMRV